MRGDPKRAVLLMDTHVWVWAAVDDPRLSRRARAAVDEAARDGRLRVAPISVWELGMLEAKGRVRLGKDCLEWVKETLSRPGVALAPFSPEIAVNSSRLPGSFHGDPADRILVATARALSARLVTKDTGILTYGRAEYVSVLAA